MSWFNNSPQNINADYKTMQEICVSIISGKILGNLTSMKAGVANLLTDFPEEAYTYLMAAETYIVNESSAQSHAIAGNYKKVVEFCEAGLKKLRNDGYIKYNKGSKNETEGLLYYYMAKAMYLDMAYSKINHSYSRRDAENFSVKAHSLLGTDETLKLYQIIAGL